MYLFSCHFQIDHSLGVLEKLGKIVGYQKLLLFRFPRFFQMSLLFLCCTKKHANYQRYGALPIFRSAARARAQAQKNERRSRSRSLFFSRAPLALALLPKMSAAHLSAPQKMKRPSVCSGIPGSRDCPGKWVKIGCPGKRSRDETVRDRSI